MAAGGGRAGQRLKFYGRPNKAQRFAVVSFPGEYWQEWRRITREEEQVEEDRQLACACVFFPKGSQYYGEHCQPCRCRELYRCNHPNYRNWLDQKAPWGCTWFRKWESNLKDVCEFEQVAVVVYKSGKVGNSVDGLGFSQRGEVSTLRRHRLACVEVDVTEFMDHILPAARRPEDFRGLSAEDVQRRLGAMVGRIPVRRNWFTVILRQWETIRARLMPPPVEVLFALVLVLVSLAFWKRLSDRRKKKSIRCLVSGMQYLVAEGKKYEKSVRGLESGIRELVNEGMKDLIPCLVSVIRELVAEGHKQETSILRLVLGIQHLVAEGRRIQRDERMAQRNEMLTFNDIKGSMGLMLSLPLLNLPLIASVFLSFFGAFSGK